MPLRRNFKEFFKVKILTTPPGLAWRGGACNGGKSVPTAGD